MCDMRSVKKDLPSWRQVSTSSKALENKKHHNYISLIYHSFSKAFLKMFRYNAYKICYRQIIFTQYSLRICIEILLEISTYGKCYMKLGT